MSPATVPSKDECIPVDLPDQTRQMHAGIIDRVIGWPDTIGFATRGGTIEQDTALVEFPQGHAVVWLRRACWGQVDPEALQETAQRVFREWARL